MTNVPLHARSAAVAQIILGRGCARIELAPPETTPVDDDREFFISAWCRDPRLVPEEEWIFIPEPNALVPGNALALRAGDVVLDGLPGLGYLVQLRIVECQDWRTPPPSSDDEGYGGRDLDDNDSDDSNHNRGHPGLFAAGNSVQGPRCYRLAASGDDAPRLGGRRGTTFMPRRAATPTFGGQQYAPTVACCAPPGATTCCAVGGRRTPARGRLRPA
jgi:hypothetical protein